jgi:hypothetical protein
LMPTFQIIARLLRLWLCEVCGDVTQVWQRERYDFVQSTDDTAHSEKERLTSIHFNTWTGSVNSDIIKSLNE